jgi:hypothetical protein
MAYTVEQFTKESGVARASRNIIVSVYGSWKTGKTHFATRSMRPLYIAYLDTNPGLDGHLLRSDKQFPGDVQVLRIPPVAYRDLTQEDALERVAAVHKFAAQARIEAQERVSRGEYGGTFVLDGAIMLKGYYEKSELGESATLGYRAARGQRGGPSTFDYAKSNALMFDFIAGFVGWPIDVVLTWEGRRVYQDFWEDGKKVSKATEKFKSSQPERLPYAINASIETLKIMEKLDQNDPASPTIALPRIRVAWSSETLAFDNMVVPVETFQEFKELLLADTVPLEVLKGLRNADQVVRANEAGILLSGADEATGANSAPAPADEED